MTRDHEVNGTAIEEIDAASPGPSMLPLHDTRSTLADLGERRAGISKRIGEARIALVALKSILERERRTT